MNFPENQKTGALAEMDVARLFTSWSWSVGKDVIDSGYDFFVEPDHFRFRGRRFLVQVKGTARRKKGAATARVKKSNLRKYAVNCIPVFLIRSSANGMLHWLHVQPWIEANRKRLTGSGETSIAMPERQRLDQPEAFLRYLDSILTPASERTGGLAEVARERTRFLSSLDPSLAVRVGFRDDAETYEIFAKEDPVSFGIEMKAADPQENTRRMRDTLHYGLPSTIEVESVRMTGSKLFKAIGADASCRGSVTFGSTAPRTGVVRLCPGSHFSILATELNVPAHLHRGNEGFAISNEQMTSLINFELRGDISPSERTAVQITLSLRGDHIATAPIREHSELANLGDWADEVLNQEALFVELSFAASHGPVRFPSESIDMMRDVLYYAFVLGRLHKVAKVLNSALTVTDNFKLTEEEVSYIHLLYSIFRGERRVVTLDSIAMSAPAPIEHDVNGGSWLIQTALRMALCGQELGTVPVAFELVGFTLEALEDPLRYRLFKLPDGNATLYYNEGGRTDAVMSWVRPASPTILT